MWQKYFFGVRPLFNLCFPFFYCVSRLGFYRITFGQLHGWSQYFLEAHCAIFRQHGQQAAWCTRSCSSQRAKFWRIVIAFAFVKIGSSTRGSYAKCIYGYYFFGFRIINQGLGLSSPTQHIPHRTSGCQHGTRGINGIASLGKNHSTSSSCEWFASYSHPVFTMQRRFLGLNWKSIERLTKTLKTDNQK